MKRQINVARTEGFAIYCTLQGFDLTGFDTWHAALPEGPLKTGTAGRREAAVQAMLSNDEVAALRHLEFLLMTWRRQVREAFLVPLARAGRAYKDRQSTYGKLTAKLTEAQKRRVREQYAERLRNGMLYGALSDIASAFKVDPKTIGRAVEDLKPKKPK